MPNKYSHIFYSGYVQGVGFRYIARNTASRLGLTGWVRNLPDGRVELVCEGNEKKLKIFLDDIAKEFPVDAQVSWDKATGEFAGFEIMF